MAAADRRRQRARPHPVRADLRRPRRRRPPVGQARQAGAHQQRRHRGRRRRGRGDHADLRRHHDRHDRRSPAAGPYLVVVPPEVVRGRGVRRRRGRGRGASPVPDSARPARPRSTTVTSRSDRARSSTRPTIVVSGGRGLGEAGKYADDRGAGEAAEGRAGRVARHRRRRLGALLATRSARPARS